MDAGSHITTVSHVEAWVISVTEWCDVAKSRLAFCNKLPSCELHLYPEVFGSFCYFAFHTFTMDLIEVQKFSFNSRARINL